MDELYSIIGKLYTDILQTQKYIMSLQSEVKEKDKVIAELRSELKKINE